MVGFIFLPLLCCLPFIYAGPLFPLYFLYRTAVRNAATGSLRNDPRKLFTRTFWLTLAWFVVTYGLSAVLTMAGCLGLIVGLVALGGGTGWLVLWIITWLQRKPYRDWERANPPPKLQIWIQDLLIALFVFGMLMALATPAGEIIEAAAVVVWWCYFFASESFGLYVALDVCRHSADLQSARRRLFFVLVVLVACAFLLPAGWAAWRMWRRARIWAALANSPPRPESKLADEVLLAARAGNLEQVRGCVERNPHLVHARDLADYTPLHHAAEKGHLEVMRLLLERGAAPDVRLFAARRTPLHLAVAARQWPAAQLLVQRGASLDAEDRECRTPRQLAEQLEPGALKMLLAPLAAQGSEPAG